MKKQRVGEGGGRDRERMRESIKEGEREGERGREVRGFRYVII